MDIKKFEKMVGEDFYITRENLASRIYQIPNHHNKYLRGFYKVSSELIDLETKKDNLYIKKRKYFLNEVDEEIKSTQVDFYIKGDPEYAALLNKVNKKKLEVKIVEEVLKRCGTISFFIKSIIDYENFLVGQ